MRSTVENIDVSVIKNAVSLALLSQNMRETEQHNKTCNSRLDSVTGRGVYA
jgi:hypothetical protein